MSDDLTQRAIDRLAREAHFKMEILLMRDDWQHDTASPDTLSNQIRKLAHQYDMPTWFVRGLVEIEKETVTC